MSPSRRETAATLIADVRERGEAALLEQAERLDGVRPARDPRDPADDRRRGRARSIPRCARRSRRPSRRVRARQRGAGAAARGHRRSGRGAAGHPALAAGRPRRALRAGRQGRLPVERRHERRARAGRRRALDRARLAAAGATFGGRVHPTILAAAGLLGVDEVYAMGGAGAIGALAYGVADARPRPGRRRHRPRQRLRRRGQAPGARAWSASTPRPARPRSSSSPTPRPTPRSSPPTWSARPSTTSWPPPCSSPTPPSSPSACRAELGRLAATHPPRASASRRRSPGRSRRSCSSTTSPRPPRSATPTAPSTSSCRPPTRTPCSTSIENAGAIFLGAHSPVSLGDYLAGSQPRAADRRARRASRRASARTTFLRSAAGHPATTATRSRAVRDAHRGAQRRRRPARARRRGRRALRRQFRAADAWRSLIAPCSARSAATPTRRVIDSRTSDDGLSIRRRRQCPECGRRFSTTETASLNVIKRSGVVEPFSREKIVSGVRKACQGRPVTDADLAVLAQKVEETIRADRRVADRRQRHRPRDPAAAARARRGRLPALRERLPGRSTRSRTSKSAITQLRVEHATDSRRAAAASADGPAASAGSLAADVSPPLPPRPLAPRPRARAPPRVRSSSGRCRSSASAAWSRRCTRPDPRLAVRRARPRVRLAVRRRRGFDKDAQRHPRARAARLRPRRGRHPHRASRSRATRGRGCSG